jgi:hypothetical protein
MDLMSPATVFLTARNGAWLLPSSLPPSMTLFVNGATKALDNVWARAWPTGSASSRNAATEFATIAEAAVRFARRTRSERVAVIGDGVLAHLVRRAAGPARADGVPDIIVDTTGVAEQIAAATRQVPSLGTVLAAAPCASKQVMLRTYGDLHVRGVTLRGLRWDGVSRPLPNPSLVTWALRHLDEGLWPHNDHFLWYRVDR